MLFSNLNLIKCDEGILVRERNVPSPSNEDVFKAKIEYDFLDGKNIMCFSAFYFRVTIWQSQRNLGHISENIKHEHL